MRFDIQNEERREYLEEDLKKAQLIKDSRFLADQGSRFYR